MTLLAAPKETFGELALFTRQPAFSSPLYVGAPQQVNVEAFVGRVRDILSSGWLTNDGPYLREFERRVAEVTSVDHCVAVSSGTAALELAIRATELSGEVIVPSFTFVATAHAVRWHGLTPVFCDVDPTTHNLDLAHVEKLVNERTSAILGVHVWGRPAYSDDLERLAERHGLRLLFDAAHAIGCSHAGQPVGGRGDAEILSFHATKVVSTLEGGAVLTNDGGLAERIRLLRNFGFVGYDDVRTVGVNAKLPEISAAMGLVTLDQLVETVAVNQRNYASYCADLDSIPGVSVLKFDESERNNFQYVVLELDAAECTLHRDSLVRVLHAENVIARRYFYPGAHRMEPYRSLYPDLVLTATEAVADRVIVLPTGPMVDPAAIETISRVIRLAVGNAERLPKVLPTSRSPAMPTVTAV